MNKLIFLLILPIFLSCSNKDDSEPENLLTGEWYLSEADCFCAIETTRNLEENTLRFDSTKMFFISTILPKTRLI